MSDISKINVDGIDYDIKDAIARNELSKKLDGNPVNIADNTNLNTLTKTGFYYCSSNSRASSLINCPTDQSFFMQVGIYYYNHYYQRIITFQKNVPEIYFRNGGGDSWGEWLKEYTTVDSPIPSVTAADNGKILKVVNGKWTAVAE
jgi:hypothetical protein